MSAEMDDDIERMAREAGYEPVNKKAYGSQNDCAVAFGEMKFPINNLGFDGPRGNKEVIGAEMYSSNNYHATQYLDGHGVIMHYSTIAGIRTRSGYIIANTEDYARGFAQKTPPKNVDCYANLNSLKRSIDIYGIVEIDGGNVWMEDGTLHDLNDLI